MSSDERINVIAPARKKLTLDSEQQERREQQERQKIEQILKRKEQKRQKRQETQRIQMEKIRLQEEHQKKYDQPQLMFQEDSDDGEDFKRVVKKIKKSFPDQPNNFEIVSKKKKDFIASDNEFSGSEESNSGSDDESQESLESQIKAKKEKKAEKKERKIQKKPGQKKQIEKKRAQTLPVKKQKVKVQHINRTKQNLVQQVAIRWWYALPEWPPTDFDYDDKLTDLGFRILDAQKFKLEEEVVNGLQKCVAVDGYKGVYKSKTKLIDVRPKDSAPTLNNFRSKSVEQLTSILKKALTVQIQQLQQVKYRQKGETELMADLERQLNKLR